MTMFAKTLAVAGAALLFSTAALADPVGRYRVRGTNPNGSAYSGEVRVTRTGDTYRVVWDIGGQTYTGTGIGDDDFIAVSIAPATRPGSRSMAASPAAAGRVSGPMRAAGRSAPTTGRRATEPPGRNS
jgi:hypothetical protein